MNKIILILVLIFSFAIAQTTPKIVLPDSVTVFEVADDELKARLVVVNGEIGKYEVEINRLQIELNKFYNERSNLEYGIGLVGRMEIAEYDTIEVELKKKGKKKK